MQVPSKTHVNKYRNRDAVDTVTSFLLYLLAVAWVYISMENLLTLFCTIKQLSSGS